MPAAILATLATQAAAAIGAGVFAANLIGAVVGGAFSMQQAKRQAKKAQRAATAAYNAKLQDRTVVLRNPIVPRNVVLGKDRTSGPLACWFTWGDKRQYHTFAVVLAGHECDSIVSHWFNGDELTVDVDGWVTAPEKYTRVRKITEAVDVTFDGSGVGTLPLTPESVSGVTIADLATGSVYLAAATFAGTTVTCADAASSTRPVTITYSETDYLFRIRSYLGGSSQTAAQELIDAADEAGTPDAWDSTRVGREVCYSTIQMEADYDVLGQIGVPNYSAVVKGVKAYDTRTATTAWTDNPAVLARWFLVESRYSPVTLSTEVGETELEASADVCDESVAFSATRTEERYTCNGQITCDNTPLENLNLILDSMDGDAVWLGGQWQIVAGYYKTPTLTINESKLSDASITISPSAPKDQLFNLVQGTYSGPAVGYQASRYQAVNPSAYVTEDNGEVLPMEMDFPLVNDDIRCQMIAWQRLTRARQQLTVTLGTNLKGYDTWPLENVLLTLSEFGWSSKPFAVRRRDFAAPRLTYLMQETASTVWDWTYSQAQAAVSIPNTSLPDASTLPELSWGTIESGDDHLLLLPDGTIQERMLVRWVAVDNFYVTNRGQIHIQYRKVEDTVWQDAMFNGSDTSGYITNVQGGATYILRARAINNAGRAGSWNIPALHVAVGKTEPPDDIEFFSIAGTVLSWEHVTNIDLAGYVIRFHYGQNTDWSSAVPLHQGLITESPFDLVTRPEGAVTLMIKAQDTSGNQSANAATISTNLGDADIANIVETIDFDALGYPGTVDGGTIGSAGSPVSAIIEANAVDSFYGTDDQSFYGADTDPFYEPSRFDELIYTTDEFTVSAALAGSVATLQLTTTGTDLFIEYREPGPGSFYGSGSDSFYGSDSDPFYGAPGPWIPWPGQIVVSNSTYQFRVTIGQGATQGTIDAMAIIIDAPDLIEHLSDVAISASGTTITYTKNFTAIQTVQATLQANGSGAETVEIDKTSPLAPVIKAYNSAHTAVSGAEADITLKGY